MEPSARTDRLYKYGFGSVRLLFLVVLLTTTTILPKLGRFTSVPLLDWTFLCYSILGIGGAILNLHILSKRFELLVLGVLIVSYLAQLILSSASGRAVLVMYLLKTIGGDGLAGKLDHGVWFRSLAIVLMLWTFLSAYVAVVPDLVNVGQSLRVNSIVFLSHLLAHWLVEMGDNFYVHVTFFRYRYTYELTALVILLVNPNPINVELVLVDMMASLSYRFTNAICTFLFWSK